MSTPRVHSLTRGQKIGIGIGVGLILPVLFFAGIMAFIMWRRQRQKKENHEGLPSNLESSGKAGGVTEKFELDANNTIHHATEKQELDAENSRNELEAHIRMHEVDGMSRLELHKNLQQHEARESYPHELDG